MIYEGWSIKTIKEGCNKFIFLISEDKYTVDKSFKSSNEAAGLILAKEYCLRNSLLRKKNLHISRRDAEAILQHIPICHKELREQAFKIYKRSK